MLKTVPLNVREGKPGRRLIEMKLRDIQEALGQPIVSFQIVRIDPGERICRTHSDWRSNCALVVLHGTALFEPLLDGEVSSDEVIADGVDSGYPSAIIPENRDITMRSADDDEHTVLLVLSCSTAIQVDGGHTVPIHGSILREQLGDGVTWLYLNSMEPKSHAAGNHYHLKKAERFFAVCGEFEVGLVNVSDDLDQETRSLVSGDWMSSSQIVLPEFAHAVRNTSLGVSRLLVFATGRPRDADDYEHQVFGPLSANEPPATPS